MRIAIATGTGRRTLLVAAATAAGLASGCAPAERSASLAPSVASAGRAATVTTALVEASTVSFALDRIDQRELPLDHTYRHFGTGRGVTVYVFDGGIVATHPEIAGRVRRGFDAFPEDEERVCNAHGTAVAGAIAGTTLGVAPAAQLVDVKMVECRRVRGTIDAIVRAARWVIEDQARHPEQRAVANWSFIADTAGRIPVLDSAVMALRAHGIPVVVSAGNVEVNACRVSPANSPGALVVGASRVRRLVARSAARRGSSPAARAPLVDERAPGTAFGSCIDVFAPGDSVLLPGVEPEAQVPLQQLWTGTSMAAGYVSGAIALFLEAHPRATPADVTEYVRRSSTPLAVDPRSTMAGLLYVGRK